MYGKLFGQFLYDKGVISSSQLKDALIRQNRTGHAIGILALEQDMLTRDQITTILARQRRTTKQFGSIAVDLGYLDQDQINHLLHMQQSAQLSLSDILVTEGYIEIDDLAAYLDLFHQENREVEQSVRQQIAATGHAPLFEIILSTSQSYFSRAICGSAKALGADTAPGTFDDESFVTATLTRTILSPEAELTFGFSLDRRTAFSLCYCLSDRVIHSWERICGVLEEYSRSLGYLVDTQLRHTGHVTTDAELVFSANIPPLQGTPLYLPFTSTIGPFLLFLNITVTS